MIKPNPMLGLRHVALHVKKLEQCVKFYTELLGFNIDWQPDKDNYYLSTGEDNFALHRAPEDFTPTKHQHLDHIGMLIATKEEVNDWYAFLKSNAVTMRSEVKDHRDGARSFYCEDPDGNVIQMIFWQATR